MKQIFLKPTQLIAMIDYPPLHSPEALFAYHSKLKAGKKIEPAIVVPVKQVIEHFKSRKIRYKKYQKILERFLKKHPTAKYFMSGGKHRSAAATILGINVPCLIVKNDNGVNFIHKLTKEGKITGVPSVLKDFEKTLQILEKHFFEHKRFWTMDEKTKSMIEHGDIPKHMIKKGGYKFLR